MTDASAFDRPTSVRWRILILMMAMAALFHFNRVSIAVAGSERFIKEFSLTESQLGVVISSYLLIYTLFMLPGGWFIDRFGPKRALMVVGFGSAILVPMTALTNFASATSVILWLCLIRGAMGLISAPFHPAAARAVSFWLPAPLRTSANGLITGAAVAGIAATYVVFGFMMDKLGWPLAFVTAGVATLVVASIWTFYAADRPREHRGANPGEWAIIERGDAAAREPAPKKKIIDELLGLLALFRSKSLLILTGSYAAYSYFQYLFFYWVAHYYSNVLKLSDEKSRAYATVTNIAMMFGMMIGGLAADGLQLRFGWRARNMVALVGMFACSVSSLVGTFAQQPLLAVASFALAMGTLGLAEAPFWMCGVELGKRRGGLSGAFLNTGGNAGGILGPLVTPLITSFFDNDWRIGMAVSSVVCMFGAGLWLLVRPASDPGKQKPFVDTPKEAF
jgi:sugar phosphate permease